MPRGKSGSPSVREIVMWHAQRKCEIRLALVEDLLKKSSEGHHNAFVFIEPGCCVIL